MCTPARIPVPTTVRPSADHTPHGSWSWERMESSPASIASWARSSSKSMGSNRTDSCWYEPAECFGGCIFSGRGGGISSGIGGGIISGLAGLGGGISSGIGGGIISGLAGGAGSGGFGGGGIISGLDRTNRGINSELAGFGGGGINSGLAGASAGLGGTGINSGLLGAFTSPVASCAAMACSVKTAWRRAGSPASSASLVVRGQVQSVQGLVRRSPKCRHQFGVSSQ